MASGNITAGNAILSAMAGIGTSTDQIETAVTRLEASGGSGGVFVENSQSLTIGGIEAAQVGLMSTSGDIVVCVNGALTVTENVTASVPQRHSEDNRLSGRISASDGQQRRDGQFGQWQCRDPVR